MNVRPTSDKTTDRRVTARRLAVAGSLVSTMLVPAPAEASTVPVSVFKIIDMGGSDAMFNWDFTSYNADENHVSFPVDLIFENAAEIDFVKDKLAAHGFCCGGDQKYAVSRDASRNTTSFYWDEDGGRKQCNFDPINEYMGCPQTAHYRQYADSLDDQMGYNSSWGYWTFATSHMDLNEGSNSAIFGESERSEGLVADAAEKAWATKYVHRNATWANMQNAYTGYGNTTEAGTSMLQSDGFATVITVY